MNLDATKYTDAKLIPFLPTSDEYFPKQFWTDLAWWNEQRTRDPGTLGAVDAAEVEHTGSAMPASIEGDLRLAGIVKRFGAVTALAGIDLGVRKGELLTILGPSGSGKTTLLKVVAGFEMPDEGEVLLGAGRITDAPPSKRDIGMVFQNYALFPHMTIADNIAFPLEMRQGAEGRAGAPRRRGAEPGRPVRARRDACRGSFRAASSSASALARAVVFGPKLLLLDEPFGALDRKLREQMQLEVRRLQRRLGAHGPVRDARPGRGADPVATGSP